MNKIKRFAILLFTLGGGLSLDAQLVFQDAPENFNPKVEVAACFIKVEDDVLFLKRLPHKAEGNCWGVPGGKCEKGDTPESAMIREIQEKRESDYKPHR